MIKTGKLLTPKHWREKINTTCEIFSCTTRRPGHQECFFWIGSVDAFSLKSGHTWPVSRCLLEFWYWTVSMATQNPINSHQRSPSGLPAPKHNISVSFEFGGILRAFKSRHTRFTMERIVKAMDEKRTLIEHHESLEGLCHWRCPCCHRKSHKHHKAWNSKFLLEKTVSRCVWLHRIYSRASEGNHGRDCGYGKRGWKVSSCESWRNSRDNRHLTKRHYLKTTGWRRVLRTRTRRRGRRRRSSVARNRVDIRPGGRRVPITQDCFWRLLWHGPFYDLGTETKANSGRRIGTIYA